MSTPFDDLIPQKKAPQNLGAFADLVTPMGTGGDAALGVGAGLYNTVRSFVTSPLGQAAGLLDIPVHALGTATNLYRAPEPAAVEQGVSDLGATTPHTVKGQAANSAVQTAFSDVLGAAGKMIRWDMEHNTFGGPTVVGPPQVAFGGEKPTKVRDDYAGRIAESIGNAGAIIGGARAKLAKAVEEKPAPAAEQATPAAPVPQATPEPQTTQVATQPPQTAAATGSAFADLVPKPETAAPDSGAPAAPAMPEVKGTRALDPSQDSVLTAAAKLGGIDAKQAASFGLDPADIAKAPGYGILRSIHGNGMPLDRMAETLAQHGYPVIDEQGNYDPNVLIQRMQDEINGTPHYSTQAQDMLAQRAIANQFSDLEAQHGPQLEAPGQLPAALQAGADSGLSLQELSQRASAINPVAAEDALQAGSDAEAARRLWQIVANAPTRSGATLADGMLTERRQNTALRKSVGEMSPDEMRQALFTSEKTGLPNGRAYYEAPKAPAVAAIDADSLKFVNDNMGHAAGDEMLNKIGAALKSEGLDAYHVSGDEFLAQGEDPATLDAALARVRDRLGKEQIVSGEHKHTPGISWGTAGTLKAADEALQASKTSRAASGLRADRGEVPPTYEGPLQTQTQTLNGQVLPDVSPEDVLNPPSDMLGAIRGINSPEDIQSAIKTMAERMRGRIDESRRGVLGDAAVRDLANRLGLTVEQLQRRRRGEAYNAETNLATRDILVTSTNDLIQRAKKAAGGSTDDLLNFQKSLLTNGAIQEVAAGVKAEAGRALRQFKMPAKLQAAQQVALRKLLSSADGTNTEKLAQMIASLDQPEAVEKFVRTAQKATTTNMIIEAWINGLLSGPQTHVVNTLSNAIVAGWMLPEHLLAAGIGKLRGRASPNLTFREVLSRGFGMVQGMRDGLSLAGKAFITEESSGKFSPFGRQSNKVETYGRAIPSVTLRAGKQPLRVLGLPVPLTGELTLGGKQVRLPGRAMTAADEFFKAVGYRSELNALAMRKGLAQGLHGKPLAEFMAQIIENPPEDLHLSAVHAAHYQTFTQGLGDIGQAVQALARAHPMMRLVLPFIRTPANIVKFGAERTPFGLLMREVRDNIRAGGIKRDIQLSRMAIGTGIGLVVANLTLEGKVTGGGPSEPNQRSALYATGWQPYSLKIGNKYYSYSRIDPLGMILGLGSDFAEISEHLHEGQKEHMAAMIMASIANNITSKTWMRGMSELINVLQDPDRYGDRYIQNFAGTLIPTGVAQYARVKDPVMRQTQDVMDALKSRLPGFSRELLPRLDIWGQPLTRGGSAGPDLLSPIYESQDTGDKVNSEIARLGIAPGMPQRQAMGVKLTPEQYNDFVRMAGQPAKQALDEIVNQPWYDKLPDAIKAMVIKRVIAKTREDAATRMLPEVGPSNVVQAKLQKYGLMGGMQR